MKKLFTILALTISIASLAQNKCPKGGSHVLTKGLTVQADSCSYTGTREVKDTRFTTGHKTETYTIHTYCLTVTGVCTKCKDIVTLPLEPVETKK